MDLKKIISLALAAIIVIGTGYEPNVVEDFFATEDQIICKDCAEKQHKLSLAVGKDLDDFKISLF